MASVFSLETALVGWVRTSPYCAMKLFARDDSLPQVLLAAIIFDWDDTLLCSSWLSQKGLRLDGPLPSADVRAQLAKHAESVVRLLRRAQAFGSVIIITNAEEGWVELSAKRFMPTVLEALKDVRVLSARSTYEKHDPRPTLWKVRAFRKEIDTRFSGSSSDEDSLQKNVLSFGDSIHEREALRACTRTMSRTLTKSVKFVDRPSLEQLKRQVDLVFSCFDDIVRHKGDLDLMLTIQLLMQAGAGSS